jgi:hypothetical protein
VTPIIEVVMNSNELTQHPDVDMVIVSVKVPGHYDAVVAGLNAGKHVYCEWPLGLNTSQAVEMNQLAAAKKVHHAVGLQARQSPEVNYVNGSLVRNLRYRFLTDLSSMWHKLLRNLQRILWREPVVFLILRLRLNCTYSLIAYKKQLLPVNVRFSN